MFKPPVGFPVQWFNGAARLDENIQAATVLGYCGDLLVIETVDAMGTKRVRRDQRHMDDPFLVDHQQWRLTHGAWDYIPGLYVNLHVVERGPLTIGSPEPLVPPEIPPVETDADQKPLRGRKEPAAVK